MRNEAVKYNEVFEKNKGKSSKLLNENEWIQSSALVELNVFNMIRIYYLDLYSCINIVQKTSI